MVHLMGLGSRAIVSNLAKVWLIASMAIALAACGDNLNPVRDAGGDAIDAPDDAPPQASGHCIDRPGALPAELRPPSGALPCEMLPPGFVAEVP